MKNLKLRKANLDKNEKRRLLLKKAESNTQANEGNFARPDDSARFLKSNTGAAARTPLSKRMVAIIVAVVMILGLIPAGVFVLRPKAEEINDLGPVEMILRVNGEEQGTAQMQAGPIADHINSVTVENAPAKLEFEGAFVVDRGNTPVTETRISSVGSYKGDDYYSLKDENNTGIKKTSRQELVLVYSSEYTVTTHPGEGGSIEVDDTVPYGTDLHVSVVAPKGYNISNVTYTIGEAQYTATWNSDGDFTIPASQVINDIEITSTYSQIETFTVKDARKVQNSKYYNLYGLEGHGGVTATIGVSAEGQPVDNNKSYFSDWSANKYQLFTQDAVLYNQQWGNQTYNNQPKYGAPAESLYAPFTNITTNSNGVIIDIQPNPVANGESTSFYVYSQSKSGNSNGWSLDWLSINGTELDYPIGTTVGSSESTPLGDGVEATVTLVSTDSPLYWNSDDLTYTSDSVFGTRYFSKTEDGVPYHGSITQAGLWFYKINNVKKHRTIYRVDINKVQENLEVAYNFKDVDKRKMIITGLKGIDETGAAYEWRGGNVRFNGSESLVDLFESRNYYFTSGNTPATSDGDDLTYWQQNIYDAFYFERYVVGVNYFPSANVYAYRVKSGYNPYTVDAKARYITDDGANWVEGDDLLAGPTADSVGDVSSVVIKASENTNADARRVLIDYGIPEEVIQEGGSLEDWVTEMLNFNSRYRFWGQSGNSELKHNDVATRDPANYSSSTHNKPVSSKTEDKLFLTKINSYEGTLQTQNVKNYKFYALALQQNEAKDQLLQLNAHPYQYNMVFDANGGTFPTTLQSGYAKLGNDEFSDTEYYTQKTAESVKQTEYYTLEDGAVTTHMPKRSMVPEKEGYFFAGWRLYQNGEPVDVEGYDEVYASNEAFVIDENSIDFSEGNVKTDANHTFTFKAEWVKVAEPAEMARVSVSVYKQTGSTADKEPDYTDGTIIENVVEQQIAGETVLLNQHKPAPTEYYVLDEEQSKIKTTTAKGSLETDENNQLAAYFKWRTADLTVAKRVTGNPKTLKDGFEITIVLTKDADSPVSATEAAAMIAASNPDNISLSQAEVNGNTVKFIGTFGRSNEITLQNVPYGWTATVSEPKAEVTEGVNPDYTTSIATHPENLGEVSDENDKTTWSGQITEDTKVTVTNDSDSFLILDKSVSRNANGTYDLQLEAYATGDVSSEKKTEKIPTDFVVIVDQSGSMAKNDMATGYTAVSGDKNLEEAANGSYYYYDSNTREYYRVYGKQGNLYEYYAPNTRWVQDIVNESGAALRWFQREQDSSFDVANQYYFRDTTSQPVVYRPITVSFEGKIGTYYCKLRYTDSNGNPVKFNRDLTTYSTNNKSPWYKNVFGDSVLNSGALYEAANAVVQGLLYRDDEAYTYSIVELSWPFEDITTGMYINYPMYRRHVGYTSLCYRDINGVEHTLTSTSNKKKAEFCDSDGNAWLTNTGNARMEYSDLYVASGTVRRLDALETALNQFVDSVAEETDDVHGNVDNKIAIVGFSSKNDGNKYNNTEVLTGSEIDYSQNGLSSNNEYRYFPYDGQNYTSTNSGAANGTNYNGPQYYNYSSSQGYAVAANNSTYENALLNVTDNGNVNPDLTTAIKSISAYGGTQPEDGFDMAYEILNNRQEKTFRKSDGTTVDRNTFVIFFTDGRPGNYSYSDQYKEANDVAKAAKRVKDLEGTYGSTPKIFSIGVFDESDGNPLTFSKYKGTVPTTAGQKPATDRNEDTTGMTQQYTEAQFDDNYVGTYTSGSIYYYLNREWSEGDEDNYGATPNDTISDYMSVVSSNYPNAEGFTSDNWISGSETDSWEAMTAAVRGDQITDENSNPVNNYYRMASNQETLIEAFKSVIETSFEEVSTATTGMDGTSALLRDVINSDDFVIPDDPEHDLVVKVYTQKGDQLEAPAQNQPANTGISFHNNEWVDITDEPGTHISWPRDENGNVLGYVDVSGFDYGANFIANGKAANAEEGTDIHEGKKLIVTISGLVPKQNDTGKLYSNTDDSGIYKLVAEDGQEEMKALQMDAFDSPWLYRYKYDFIEPHVYSKDKFDIVLTRDGTDSVLATYNDQGERSAHFFENNSYTWSQVANGDAIYWELLETEKDDALSANVPAPSVAQQKQYTYSLALIDSDENSPNAKTFGTTFSMKNENSTIQVTNVSNLRDVIITEETKGVPGEADFSDTTHEFPIQMTLMDGNTPVSGKIDATITRNGSDTSEPIELNFGSDGKLNTTVKLADGDKIEFETLKDYTLTVYETENDAGEYAVTYDPDDDPEDDPYTDGTTQTIGDTNSIKVINTLKQNPVITGFNGGSTKLSTIFFAVAGILALGGGAWLLIQYKRKKEEALEAYKNSLNK